MDTLFALVVGIDEYDPPLHPLRGCGNDADQVLAYLTARVPAEHREVRDLRNGQATREAIETGFREHLARAGSGDTALFWFSGHGSLAPPPRGRELFEGTGMSQTLVCAGPRAERDAVVDLWDDELNALIRLCGANGAHVVVVLDCCHSDGASRDQPDETVRLAPPLSTAPAFDRLLPELSEGVSRDGRRSDLFGPRAVVLSACGVDQLARERTINGTVQGVFSHGLLRHLNRPGRIPTYRDLMTGARVVVEDRVRHQHPVLRPMTDPLVDRPFLGGTVGAPVSTVRMRSVRGTWEVNVGACHGVTTGIPGASPTFGVVDADQQGTTPEVRQVRVLQSLTDRCLVEPIGWHADSSTQYPVVLTGMPSPATTLAITAHQPGSPSARLLVDALHQAAMDGGPSPYLSLTGRHTDAEVVLHCDHSGQVMLHGPAAASWADVRTPARAAEVIRAAEHVARWLRIKGLHNPTSGLTAMARVEVVAAKAGEQVVPINRAAMRTDDTGTLQLRYHLDNDGTWQAPDVFIRISNRGNKPLYCALLDLTDRYQVDAGLFEGDWIGPRREIWIDSEPLQLALPPAEQPQPGAAVRDWLFLLVAELRFDTAPFTLPRLGDASAQAHHRDGHAFADIVRKLGLRTQRRAGGGSTTVPADWTTSILPIVTSVPKAAGAR
jgi:hypothetical protein